MKQQGGPTSIFQLRHDHFNSEVAKIVFDDLAAQELERWQATMGSRVLNWTQEPGLSSGVFMRFAVQLDRLVVPRLSKRHRREFSRFVATYVPHALPAMQNTYAHVNSLARAVQLSKFLSPGALDRIHQALVDEGLC